MAHIPELAPKQKLRLMDLVQAAGVDVSDWPNFKRGKKWAAANPRYCYEWAFVEPGQTVVLNIWHHFMKKDDAGVITRELNMRKFATERPEPESSRARRMDEAIQTAVKQQLPVRVVVLAGKTRSNAVPDEPPSKVTGRLLDSVNWAVTEYDWATGHCTLTRGVSPKMAQSAKTSAPDVDEDAISAAEGRKRWVQHFQRERDRKIVTAKKRQVLAQQGKLVCEACGFDFTEFYAPHAANFCEVHHRKPLAELQEGAETKLIDLAAMCSNCHRVIHLIKPMPSVEEFRSKLSGRR